MCLCPTDRATAPSNRLLFKETASYGLDCTRCHHEGICMWHTIFRQYPHGKQGINTTRDTRFRENLDMAILPLPLIQEEHWPAIGEIMHTKKGLNASGRLAPPPPPRNSVDRITDPS